VQSKSYLTHNPTFSTPNSPEACLKHQFGKALRMKFAAVLTALAVGFIAGLTFNPPDSAEIVETQIKLRREIIGNSS